MAHLMPGIATGGQPAAASLRAASLMPGHRRASYSDAAL